MTEQLTLEKIDDLQKFNSEEFVNALFDKREED